MSTDDDTRECQHGVIWLTCAKCAEAANARYAEQERTIHELAAQIQREQELRAELYDRTNDWIAAQAEATRLRKALAAVLKEADRDTDAFRAARAALRAAGGKE